jgi:hypothetical protein
VRSPHIRARLACNVLALLATGVAVAGCGGGGAAKPTNLNLSIAEQGKAAQFTVPASAKGGLTNIQLTNSGKAPHSAQLILVTKGHTPAEAIRQLGTNVSPDWMRAEGGVGTVPGGQSGTATVNLPKGTYAVVDTAGIGGGGPPAYSQFKLTGGKRGKIGPLPARITGVAKGPDRYAWRIRGLKAGTQPTEFTSKGKNTIHAVEAFRLKPGANPSLGTIKKALQSNGPPPAFIDANVHFSTAALDSGKSLTSPLTFTAGRYVVFCPLTDRNGGKPHFLEGMLRVVTIP